MGPVTAVTFAGAGPQTGWRGPREPQAAIVLSPRKPASLCQTCFSVCFLFYVFNVGKGECFPLSSPPLPLHCSALFPPNTHLPPPPTHLSTFVSTLFPPTPLSLPYFVSPVSPWRSSFVKLFAVPYLCRGVAASRSALLYLHLMKFWHKLTFFLPEKQQLQQQCKQL